MAPDVDHAGWRRSIDPERLAEWMARAGLGSGDIEAARLLTGGTQNLLLHFRLGERAFVLRRPPPHLRSNSNQAMDREARVLGALAGTNVPHPRLIAASADTAVIGASFYLMEPVAGFNATVEMPGPYTSDRAWRRAMGFAMVDAIAALGEVDHIARGLADFGRSEGFLERQVDRWKGQLASYGELHEWPGPTGLPHVADICAWLEDNRPRTYSPGVLHGDYHLANVMFDHDRPQLAAVVDWELSTIGDPRLDLGWLLATWPDPAHDHKAPIVEPWDNFPSPAELVDRYANRSHRNLDEIAWFAVLACFKMGVILEGTFARSCAGLAPVETGERLRANAVNLFQRAMRFIGDAPAPRARLIGQAHG
jgi:aminoglycoside phosphotransferase (APT) family kinase protein